MKIRCFWLFFAAYFPYHFLLAVHLMRSGLFGVLYENAAPPVILSSACVWLLGMIGAIVWGAFSVHKNDPARRMYRSVGILFALQIPAALIFLYTSFFASFTIMTIPVRRFYLPICAIAFAPTLIALVFALYAQSRRKKDSLTQEQEAEHASE